MQFQQLASVIFIEPAMLPDSAARRRSSRLPVVEVEEHGGTLRGGAQQVFELAEDMRANGIALVGSDQIVIRALVDENVEVVVPEVGEDLFQLPFAVDRTEELGFEQILGHNGLRPVCTLN